jgi:hypothetical protein
MAPIVCACVVGRVVSCAAVPARDGPAQNECSAALPTSCQGLVLPLELEPSEPCDVMGQSDFGVAQMEEPRLTQDWWEESKTWLHE